MRKIEQVSNGVADRTRLERLLEPQQVVLRLPIFTARALRKRCVELTARIDKSLSNPSSRNCRKPVPGVIAATAGADCLNAAPFLQDVAHPGSVLRIIGLI
jgi:hypothetical protein